MIKKYIKWYQGDVYIKSVKTIFESVMPLSSYSEWKERYIYIHGFLDTQRKIDTQKLEKTFGINIGSEKEELFKLIYSLEIYYYIILRLQ